MGNNVVWSSNDESKATVDNQGRVTGKSAGSVTITYKYTNSNGCTNTQDKQITVNPLPQVSISGDKKVCEASTINLTGSPNNNGTGTWTSSNTNIASVDNTGKVSAKKAGNTNIIYSFKDNKGCIANDTSTITVNPKPEADYVVTDGNGNKQTQDLALNVRYYFKDISKLKDNSNVPKDGKWVFSNGIDETKEYVKEFSKVFHKSGFFTLDLTLKNNYNCVSSQTKTFERTKEFKLHWVKYDTSTIHCVGNYYFEVRVINPTGEVKYSWFIDNKNQNNTSNSLSHYFESGTHTITVSAIDGGGNGVKLEISIPNFIVNKYPKLKENKLIPDLDICKSDNPIDIQALYNNGDVGSYVFKSYINDTLLLSNQFNPSKYSGTVTIEYYLDNGGCESEHKTFNITVKEIEPVAIDIINDVDNYCAGDTIKIKTKTGWNWTPSGMHSIKMEGDTIIYFKLGESNTQSLEVSKEENGCTSNADSVLTVNPLPNIPSLFLPSLCNGTEDTLSINLKSNETIIWLNHNEDIITLAKDTFIFIPDTTVTFDFTIRNSGTTCSADSFLSVDVIRVDPVIIPIDSCGGKMGNIFAIKKGTVSPEATKTWTIDGLGTIISGKNTNAILVDHIDTTTLIKVEVFQNSDGKECKGDTVLSNIEENSFLLKSEDSLTYQTCGAVIYDKNAQCSGNYIIGYIDHDTGDFFRSDTFSKPYFVDITREEDSDRTYFINCSDCEETKILNYLDVRSAIEAGCNEGTKDIEIVLAPNPAMNQFDVFLKGKYKGNIILDMYNAYGQKVRSDNYKKRLYSDKVKLQVQLNSGIYYLRIYGDSGLLTTVPIVILK